MSEGAYYDKKYDTLVISGTKSLDDVLIDAINVPTNTITTTERYKEAAKLYEKHKPSTIVSHSLGSLIANEINNRYNHKGEVYIYNAPLVSGISRIRKNVKDYSQYGDIVSGLDFTARRKTGSINPIKAHSYKHD